jgi:ABC-type bacteriocin transporter
MASKKVKQHDIKDCGAACLASLGNHYRIQIPIARIRQMANTDLRGTNVLGMVQAAEKMGLKAKGIRGNWETIAEMPLPAIAHLHLKNGLQHYVVIYRANAKKVIVMDPATGTMETYTKESWLEIWTGVTLLAVPGEAFMPISSGTTPLFRLWKLIEPHRIIWLQAIIGALIYTLLGLGMSIYIQKITDYVLVDGNRNLLNLLSMAMIGILFLQVFVGANKSIMVMKTGLQMDARLLLGYYQHVVQLPQAFFDTMRVGEITSRLNDAIKIRHFINDVALELLVNCFVIVFTFALMFYTYSPLAMLIVWAIPAYGLVYWLTNWRNKRIERDLMEDAAQVEIHVVESLQHSRTVKEFSISSFIQQKAENRFVKLLLSAYEGGKNALFTTNSTHLISQVVTIAILWKGAGYVLDRAITPGELFSFYALVGYITNPMLSLMGANKSVQHALIASERLFDIMDLEVENNPTDQIAIGSSDLGDIRLVDVGFMYGTRTNVFDQFNVCFKQNQWTAVVGESGSGKSTLFALIQKLYPTAKGQIYIGKHDLQMIHLESLRKLIRLVPQHVALFAGNFIENIALGEENPDLKRVVQLCQQVGIASFIERLPNTYYSLLGENGAMLSGGQKQRVAIARALYHDPSILLLDEVTSALDAYAEAEIQSVFMDLIRQGKTVISIAHRLSSVVDADQIIFLREGRVSETGTHTDLLEKRGDYWGLWQKQHGIIQVDL